MHNSHRRGMYFQHTPYSQTEFLKLFDAANPTGMLPPPESIIPQQALALANSELSLNMARKLARKFLPKRSGNSGFVAAAPRRCWDVRQRRRIRQEQVPFQSGDCSRIP